MGILDRIRMLKETWRHKRYDAGRELDKCGYNLIRCLDRGRFGIVHLALAKASGSHVVVKVVDEGNFINGENYGDLWRRINHNSCITLYRQFTIKGYTHYVCEYAAHGDVMSWLESSGHTLGPHLENLSRRITGQVLLAFQYCHGLQMAHLDFRWTNVLLDGNLNAKLTGFSYLCCKTDAASISLGDPLYHPPEALTTGVSREHMDKVDMWQLGAALIHLLMGWYVPVLDVKGGVGASMYDVAVVMDVNNHNVSLPHKIADSGASQEFQEFVTGLMKYNPEARPSATQALNDYWLLIRN